MQYTHLGRSGATVSRLALGTMNFGWVVGAYIRRAVEDSLRRLGTDHIDLYRFHHVDRSTPWDELWEATERLVRDGKVVYVGSSNFAGWHLAQASEMAKARHFLGLVSEQSIYNLMSGRSASRSCPRGRSSSSTGRCPPWTCHWTRTSSRASMTSSPARAARPRSTPGSEPTSTSSCRLRASRLGKRHGFVLLGERGGPAREEVEGVRGAAAGLGGVDARGQAGVGGEVHGLVGRGRARRRRGGAGACGRCGGSGRCARPTGCGTPRCGWRARRRGR